MVLRRAFFGGLAALHVLGLGARAAAVGREVAPAEDKRLVTGIRAEPKHFNPFAALDRPTRLALGLVMADLVTIDRETQATVTNLARSYEISDDGRRFTVILEDGVRFSDGEPMDADDVVFSFEAYLDERTGAPQRDLLIVGGEPIRVRKLDERRVQFELAEPYAAGERLFDSIFILPRHKLLETYRRGELGSLWPLLEDPSEIVGLGPFRVRQVVPGERIVFERNPYYWKTDATGRSLPYLDEVVLEIVSSEETEALRLKRGEIHIAERLSPSVFADLDASAPSVRARDLGAGFEYNLLFFNLNDLPGEGTGEELERKQRWFRDPRFRRAVSRAVDRRGIVRLVYGGRATPLATHVTPGNRLWIDEGLRPDTRSVESARALLREAGFRWDGRDRLRDPSGALVSFSILTSASNEERKRIAAVLTEDLRELGMEVTITTLEFRSFVDRIFQGRDYDACLLGLGGGDADPNPEMSLLLSRGSMHVWRLDAAAPGSEWQAEIDELMTAQLTALDRERRREMYDRVQRLVAEFVPFVSLVSPHVLVAYDRRLDNVRPGVLPPYTLWNVEEIRFGTEGTVQ